MSVARIIRRHSIIDYLSRRGHEPDRRTGQRVYYRCPIPDHKDTDPSFVVWTNAEFENFYCFGCRRGWNIIHLISLLEGKPYRQVVEELSGDEDLQGDIESEIARLDRQYRERLTINLATALFSIASLCRRYLSGVRAHLGEQAYRSECELIDRLYLHVDRDLILHDVAAIRSTMENLPAVLQKRRERLLRNR